MSVKDDNSNMVREPVVAGQFYPADARELAQQIDGFLSQARTEKLGRVRGLIVPHAGYIYSGQVAAFGFKQLAGESVDTVILIGNSHHAYFDGAAIYDKGYFKTPLGEVAIDEDLAGKIIAVNKAIKADVTAHAAEHSLEVEVPFLQRILKNFKLVPILMGNADTEDIKILAEAIGKNIIDKNILVVVSSDMSHYPSYKQANYADQKTCEAILTGQVDELENMITQLEKENIIGAQTFLCGKDAVEVLMMVMQDLGISDIKLLKYANSGDATGERTGVVGYSAIVFSEAQAKKLDIKERQRLLAIARQAVESYVRTGQVPVLTENSLALNQRRGVFVTLRKHGQLRGCIGNFTDSVSDPLWLNVMKMAVAAAAADPRFSPVVADELSSLFYEISILSPLERVKDWRQIKLGEHGVEVKCGSRSGVFLPQVASETGWDMETFMGCLCSQKAGLPADAWKDPKTELYTFTAQVFEN